MKPTLKKDNSFPEVKIAMRNRYVRPDDKVLDLYCGTGEMYDGSYRGVVAEYVGIDKAKVHTPDICHVSDNARWVRQNDISRFTVFDLDAYGSPLKLLNLVLSKATQPRATAFLTDGTPLRLRLEQNLPRVLAASEGVRKSAVLYGVARWYVDITCTAITKIVQRNGYQVDLMAWTTRTHKDVYYWVIQISKRDSDADDR